VTSVLQCASLPVIAVSLQCKCYWGHDRWTVRWTWPSAGFQILQVSFSSLKIGRTVAL